MFTFDLNAHTSIPLYEQLYHAIRKELETGNIRAGEKLPSKRELASHLKISVVTVETAYAQLIAEGYLTSRPGSGFYAESIPYCTPIAKADVYIPVASAAPEYQCHFQTNMVDADVFPFSTWAKLSREVLSERNPNLLRVCDVRGLAALRVEIAAYLKQYRGICVHPEQIIIGAGSEYLTGLMIQLLGRDRVYGIENPGYPKIYRIFHSQCRNIQPISMDASGADCRCIHASGVDVIHITPSHHFPLGMTMPISRRMEILHWVYAEEDRYIIEDDYDSEFRFSGKPVPAMQSLDSKGRVIYINTFTKSLAPSMRISYMVLPPALLERFMEKLGFYACTVPVFEQLTLSKFMERGHFERHIRRMKKLYHQRRDVLTNAIHTSRLQPFTRLHGLDAGLHVLMRLQNGMSEQELLASAEREGVRVYGLSEYNAFSDTVIPESCIIAGYSGLREAEILDGVSRLEKAWA